MIKQWQNGRNSTDKPYTNIVGVYEPEYGSTKGMYLYISCTSPHGRALRNSKSNCFSTTPSKIVVRIHSCYLFSYIIFSYFILTEDVSVCGSIYRNKQTEMRINKIKGYVSYIQNKLVLNKQIQKFQRSYLVPIHSVPTNLVPTPGV